jgi:hypothetical protein
MRDQSGKLVVSKACDLLTPPDRYSLERNVELSGMLDKSGSHRVSVASVVLFYTITMYFQHIVCPVRCYSKGGKKQID